MDSQIKRACLLVAFISLDSSAEETIPCNIADEISNTIYVYLHQMHAASSAATATAINDLSVFAKYAKGCEGLASDIEGLRRHHEKISRISPDKTEFSTTSKVPNNFRIPKLEHSSGSSSVTSSEAPRAIEIEGGRTGLPIQQFDNHQLQETWIDSSER